MSEGWLVECQRWILGAKSKTRAAFATYEKAVVYATPWLEGGGWEVTITSPQGSSAKLVKGQAPRFPR